MKNKVTDGRTNGVTMSLLELLIAAKNLLESSCGPEYTPS